MSERRAKDLCYFCDKPYTSEYSLTHKKIQIYVMEIQETLMDQELSDKEE